MCAIECSARCYARRDGRAMWVACNRARFPATRPRVFCELKIMKMVILIYLIIQQKFAYVELFMLVMTAYISMFKMVKKNANFRFRNGSWVNTPSKALRQWPYCPSRMELSYCTFRFGAIIQRNLQTLSLPRDSPQNNLYACVIWVHVEKATI